MTFFLVLLSIFSPTWRGVRHSGRIRRKSGFAKVLFCAIYDYQYKQLLF